MTAQSRRSFMAAAIGAAMFATAHRLAAAPGLWEFRRLGAAFGTTVSMLVPHDDAASARQALDAASAEIRAIERAASLFTPASDINRLNRYGALSAPNFRLVELLRLAAKFHRRTGGSFDITVQPYWAARSTATTLGRAATDAELLAARAKGTFESVAVDRGGIRFVNPGMGIALNGIARGYATDRVIKLLQDAGIRHALIDTDGFGTLGQNRDRPWSVAIAHPRQPGAVLGEIAPLTGFLSTSSDHASAFSPDLRDNHIFTPATGCSPLELASATVLAPTGAQADALSTALMVLGARRGLDLIASLPGRHAIVATKDGKVCFTAGAPFAAM